MIAYSFDDVLLVPQNSNLRSRSEVDLSTVWPQYHETQDDAYPTLRMPILSSPMDTVTDINMQKAMQKEGLFGIHHRYCSEDILLQAIEYGPIAISPSQGIEFLDRVMGRGLQLGVAPIVVLDVAHGDSISCYEYAKAALERDLDVVSANICTDAAAFRYLDIGVMKLRVGVGAGSVCTTRSVAGVGMPQFTAIEQIRDAVNDDAYIIADGGMKKTADIVKALAAGADFVILGRMLAGADEAPGRRFPTTLTGTAYYTIPHAFTTVPRTQKEFRGMASAEALDDAGKERNIEGASIWIDVEGSLSDILDNIERGLRAGYAYCGAKNTAELQRTAEFVLLTPNGRNEGFRNRE